MRYILLQRPLAQLWHPLVALVVIFTEHQLVAQVGFLDRTFLKGHIYIYNFISKFNFEPIVYLSIHLFLHLV